MKSIIVRHLILGISLLGFLGEDVLAVDLKDEQLESIASTESSSGQAAGDSSASKQWFDRFHLSGNMGLGTYYARYQHHSTSDFTIASSGMDGHAYVDGNLYIEAKVWDDLFVFMEWYTTGGMSPWHNNASSSKPIDIGEAYLRWKNFYTLPVLGELSLKVGTFDLPFGEEYNWQDKIDNPLILNSASWPWAIDQGIMLFGKSGEYGWIFSVTDGSVSNSSDEHPSKAYNLKVYGKPHSHLYLSASIMKSGTYSTPALWLGNNTFPKNPVSGVGVASAEGGELDLVANPLDWLELSANVGIFKIEDGVVAGRDRTLHWWMLQPKAWITDKVYGILRYSNFGANQAYKWMYADPVILSSTSPGLPFQANMQTRNRYEAGVGYKANPNTVLKLEFARDKFKVDGGTLDPSRDNLDFLGFEVAVKF